MRKQAMRLVAAVALIRLRRTSCCRAGERNTPPSRGRVCQTKTRVPQRQMAFDGMHLPSG
jgi:hypothetical protein